MMRFKGRVRNPNRASMDLVQRIFIAVIAIGIMSLSAFV